MRTHKSKIYGTNKYYTLVKRGGYDFADSPELEQEGLKPTLLPDYSVPRFYADGSDEPNAELLHELKEVWRDVCAILAVLAVVAFCAAMAVV